MTVGSHPSKDKGWGTRLGFRKRQFANPLSVGREDCIADRGRKRRHTRLAHSRRRGVTIYNVDAGLVGSFVHSSHGIVIEIRLLNDSIFRGNRPAAHNAGSEHRRTLELGPGSFW